MQTIGIDLAKNVFELAISRRPGKVHQRRRLSRARLLPFFAQCPRSVVVMEARGSAHAWGRVLRELGHEPRLLPPSLVKPYVVRNKSDRADAEALLEAHRNRRIREVPVKTLEQQNLAAMHRMRAGWISTRVEQINRVRAILREINLVIPQGARTILRIAQRHPDDPLCRWAVKLRQQAPHNKAAVGVANKLARPSSSTLNTWVEWAAMLGELKLMLQAR
jgi:transposase